MKKDVILLFAISIFLSVSASASGDGNSILKLSTEPLPFNELRDPVNDSLYNAFDGNPESSALFSDASIQFNTPILIDELKIVNGNFRMFKQFSRLRDIEITLYTVEIKADKKSTGVGGKKVKDVRGSSKEKQSSVKTGTEEKKLKKEDKSENPVKNRPSDGTPQKDNRIKNNEGGEKEAGGLTLSADTADLQPVIGTLNTVLAVEPDRPVSVEKEKTDIRDIDKTPAVRDSSLKKNPDAADEKKLKSKAASKKNVKKEKKAAVSKTEAGKNKKSSAEDDIPFRKMEGISRIENDSEGRVLLHVSLRDIPAEQSIKLGGVYNVASIDIRKRDDNYSNGDSPLPYLSEISFLNRGKRISFQGMEKVKKEYEERFVRALEISISGRVYSVFDNDREVARILFRENGRIEIRDRYKCIKKGDAGCTSSSMPDMWMIRDGRLYMRYMNEWVPWKYELEYTPDIMNGAQNESDSRQWLKLYYRNGAGFSENFIYLEKSAEQEWRWDQGL